MKALISVLVVLGIVAALCAALIVTSWKPVRATAAAQPTSQPASPEVDVLYAAACMPALSMVEPKSVLLKRMSKDVAPEGYLSNPAAVIGHALASPMVEGQAFTAGVLAAKNSGINLAAALPDGMRAISVSLANYESLQGLLYPGGFVDVLFSFKGAMHEEKTRGQKAVSLTLLKGIEVLAVGEQTIITGEATPLLGGPSSDHKQMVTLLVNPKQAELLQLAQENGNISLAMRNPLESSTSPATETQLAQLVDALSDKVEAVPTTQPAPAMALAPPKVEKEPNAPLWEIQFIHGVNTEVQCVPLPNPKTP